MQILTPLIRVFLAPSPGRKTGGSPSHKRILTAVSLLHFHWDPSGCQAALQRHLLVPAGDSVHLLLHEQADSADCILGFVHAYLVQHCQAGSSGGGGVESGDFHAQGFQ